MSDPVKNIEIEDVLSSIRRLVSEEKRPDLRSAKPAAPAEPADRLVLTPSLRVAETEAQDLAADFAEDTTEDLIEDDVAEVDTAEAADDSATDIAEADSADAAADIDPEAPWRDPKATLYKAAQVIAEETANQAEDESVADTDQDAQEDTAEMAVDLMDGSEPEGDWTDPDDAAVSETLVEDWGNDAAEDQDKNTADEQSVDHGEDHLDDEADDMAASEDDQSDHSDHPGQSETEGTADTEQAIAEAVSLSAKIEVLEAAVADTADQWEPDGAGQDDYSGTRVETMQWHDVDSDEDQDDDPVGRTRATTDAGARSPIEDDASDSSDDDRDFLVSDEAVLDEESLRELVADIVREELQGALGERITRNVRKLVRREIHRALATQELE